MWIAEGIRNTFETSRARDCRVVVVVLQLTRPCISDALLSRLFISLRAREGGASGYGGRPAAAASLKGRRRRRRPGYKRNSRCIQCTVVSRLINICALSPLLTITASLRGALGLPELVILNREIARIAHQIYSFHLTTA